MSGNEGGTRGAFYVVIGHNELPIKGNHGRYTLAFVIRT